MDVVCLAPVLLQYTVKIKEYEMIEIIKNENEQLGIIIRNDFKKEGVHFFTPDDFSQQLAYMSHKAGKVILPHRHNKITREVHFTQEVLVIKKGILRVDFYSDVQEYVSSRHLYPGDVILLADGGHGFEVVEDVEMYEIKQGPFLGPEDKVIFEPVEKNLITFKETHV